MRRITVRRLMALIVLAACLSGLWAWGLRWSERAARRRSEAAQHQMRAMCWSELAKHWPDGWSDSAGTWSTQDGGTTYLGVFWDWRLGPGQRPEDVMRDWDGVKRACLARAAHHERMARAWYESARRFWAGEPTEPPRPPIRSARLKITAE